MTDVPELPADLDPVLEHLCSVYPNEGCGLVFRGSTGRFRVQPMRNAVSGPGARTQYRIDPAELLRAEKAARANNEALTCIFHSHVDAPAQLSDVDRAEAAPGGEPLFPGVAYLVLGCHRGVIAEARLYRWVAGQGYSGQIIPL